MTDGGRNSITQLFRPYLVFVTACGLLYSGCDFYCAAGASHPKAASLSAPELSRIMFTHAQAQIHDALVSQRPTYLTHSFLTGNDEPLLSFPFLFFPTCGKGSVIQFNTSYYILRTGLEMNSIAKTPMNATCSTFNAQRSACSPFHRSDRPEVENLAFTSVAVAVY